MRQYSGGYVVERTAEWPHSDGQEAPAGSGWGGAQEATLVATSSFGSQNAVHKRLRLARRLSCYFLRLQCRHRAQEVGIVHASSQVVHILNLRISLDVKPFKRYNWHPCQLYRLKLPCIQSALYVLEVALLADSIPRER